MNKVTCGAHRREGYAFVNGRLLCRECKGSPEVHETLEETYKRLNP